MAKNGIKVIGKALKKGFTAKGAEVRSFVEKSDYKDFIRMYVISDFFRGMAEKDRLGEVFDVLEANGAKDAIGKISLCVAMTEKEYEKEFGPDVFLGVDLDKTYQRMKSRPRFHRALQVQGRK